MASQSSLSPRKPQARSLELIESRGRATRRKRLADVHRGALTALDAAVEARCSTEEPAREHELVRADVQDLFAWCTRRELRKLQGELRSMESRLSTMRAELCGRAA